MVRRLALLLAVTVGLGACGDGTPAPVRGDGDVGEARRRQTVEAERVGFPVEVANDLGMRFRLIPTGSFQMGSPDDAPGAYSLITRACWPARLGDSRWSVIPR